MNGRYKTLLVLALLFVVSGCGGEGSEKELTISAAASLQGTMNEIKKEFEKEQPDVKLVFNFGGSGSLQRQIEQGAPADMFLSAAKENTEALSKKNLIDGEVPFIANKLMLIAPINKPCSSLETCLEVSSRIASGTPETVPAGKYALSAIPEEMRNKSVYGKDVRTVLTLVEQGSADIGFVYQSDVTTSKKVTVVEEIKTTEEILYYGGILEKSSQKESARQFMKFLRLPRIQQLFAENGFTPLTTQQIKQVR
ncbi:molybdate ABC transporter substrate-binding protein [Fictibacillus iocasae]|uniref:Molybdate ABC transporter substrate-binding protein n=1 Tax=Fictibacillus iocasae TaxID=2715437 RepID=A0ABW2NQJ6_9BACL